MLKKTLSVLAILFCVNTLLSTMSCMRCEGCAGDMGTYCVSASSFELSAYMNNNSVLLDTGSELLATTLRLDVRIKTNSQICYRPKSQQNFSLFSTAYACSLPDCRTFSSVDSIIAYDVYSDKDYDAGHLAGASLKELFPPIKGYQSLKMYHEQDTEFRLLCSTAPADTGTHILTVMMVQKDGDTVRMSTPPVKLLK